jgi:hypothetical protein
VTVGEARGLPDAVRAGPEVAGLSVLPDAERGGDLVDGGVAALDGRDDLLPQV